MKSILKTILATALGLTINSAFATPPKQLVTHNTTDSESNAFIAGVIPSQHPTKAHSEERVFWAMVKMACFGYVVNGKCPALIRMDTNTAHPIDLGVVQLDLETGDITPKSLTANGYTLLVNGPGETTIIKN